MAQNTFDDDQVNEILSRAGQLEVDAEGQFDRTSMEMLESSAEEAGLDREHVQQAVKQLEAEWRARRAAKRARQAMLRNTGIVVVVIIFLSLGMGAMKRSGAVAQQTAQVQQLQTLKGQVDQAAAQLDNVMQRRENLAKAGNLSDPTMRDELVGAENRVATERKRYNEVVTQYNNLARQLDDPSYPPLEMATGEASPVGSGF